MKKAKLVLGLATVFSFGGLYFLSNRTTFPFVLAQDTCCNPPLQAPSTPRFSQNAQVTVYIDSSSSGFTSAEQQLIKSGIEDWNDEPNNSHVTYNVVITSSPPAAGTNNTILVQFSNQFSSGTGGVLLNLHSSSGPAGTSIYAEMIFFNNMRDPQRPESSPEQIRAGARHEIAHGIGLANATNCPEGSTIMNPSWTQETFITPCDNGTINSDPNYPTPTPTPTPPPTSSSCADNCPNPQQYAPATCFGPADWCQYPDSGCESDLEQNGRCCCSVNTPIVIDVLGDGFSLTSFENGVQFDLAGSGVAWRTSWTLANSDDAFLVLDRNGNGTIDNGLELFGNMTAQPQPPAGVTRNGFFALAEYDEPAKGGNGDNVIDQRDAVYGSLRLWRDLNHNGFSEPGELSRLIDLQVHAISLDFRESRRRDEWGNGFRYRSKVYGGGNLRRWAYDIVVQTVPLNNI